MYFRINTKQLWIIIFREEASFLEKKDKTEN